MGFAIEVTVRNFIQVIADYCQPFTSTKAIAAT